MPNLLLPEAKRCRSITAKGDRCGAPALPGRHSCVRHDAEAARIADLRTAAKRLVEPVVPELPLSTLANLDVSRDEDYRLARRGIWQHLLAGSLDPTTAKTALGIARELHSEPSESPKASPVADLASAPPARED